MPGVKLYGKNLFGSSYKSSIVTTLNNAPGGSDGVDEDVQYRLGAPGASQILDRKHGICCGITIAWLIGYCHGREDAVNTTNFQTYYTNVLRFQGAYMKDNKGNVESIDDLNGIYPHGLMRAASGKCIGNQIGSKFPGGSWAAYLGIWHHAIGIGANPGWFGSRYCIMDPNGGLFKYNDATTFKKDLLELIEARRVRKGADQDAKISYTFFKKT